MSNGNKQGCLMTLLDFIFGHTNWRFVADLDIN